MSLFHRVGTSLLCLWFCTGLSLWAGGTLTGTVKNEDGRPIVKAEILLLSLNRAAKTNPEGTFLFEDVPAGEHRLQISHDSFGHRIQSVTINDAQKTEVSVTFDLTVHEAMTISASPVRKSIADVSQAIGVLNEDDILRVGQPTLGETLASEPGITSTFFGQASSRPIIRGLGGDRIRVLEGGIGTGDVSTVSADHAVTIDPNTVERIEILRGPASLRYGGNAVGGIVNIIDNRIPEFIPTDQFAGSLDLGWDQASERQNSAFSVTGATGRLAVHADYAYTDAGDYEIPEAAEADEDEPFNGTLENSALETTKANLGVSYITDRGYFGVSFSDYQNDYGVPGHHHHHEDEHGHDDDHDHDKRNWFKNDDDDHGDEHGHGEEEEESVTIDLDQTRFDARGELRFDHDNIKSVNVRAGFSDYEHVELEGGAVGTTFENEFQELRVETVFADVGPFTNGSVGLHYINRKFSAVGEEAFVPENETENLAGFVYGEIERNNWSLVMGTRFGRQKNNTPSYRTGTSGGHDHDDDDHDDDHGDDDHDDDHGDDDHDDDDHGDDDDDHGDDEDDHGDDDDDHGDDDDDHGDDDDDHGDDDHDDDDHGDDDHDDDGLIDEATPLDIDFTVLSGSIGVVYGRNDPLSFAANATFTERAPTAEELFSFGPHLATNSFEFGNPELNEEQSFGIDVLFRKNKGIVTGELSLFSNRFSDFIYQSMPEAPDDEEELAELFYTQEDADFWGGELHLDVSLFHTDPHHVHLEMTYDYVRGELSNGGNLPRITPARLNLALEYSTPRYWIKGESRFTQEQDRVAENETPTDSFTMLNLYAGYRLMMGRTKHQLIVRGTNLGDETARVHTSFIKDRVLLQGRSVSLSYKMLF